jgi:hypothetical protein
MFNINFEVVIFSVDKGLDLVKDDQNRVNAELLLTQHGVDFKKGNGCYKGSKEKCFVVVLSPNPESKKRTLDRVRQIARDAKQESILFVHHDRFSELQFFDGKASQGVEYLHEITNPNEFDAYTELDGKFFACL